MDAEKEAKQYRLLAARMRAEAKLMDGIAGHLRLETARTFEKIAEHFENVASERAEDDRGDR